MTSASPRPQAMIVHAHPEPASFTTAQADVAAEVLAAEGYAVDRIDLYGQDWDPVLDRHEFPGRSGYFKPQAEQQSAVESGTLDPTVNDHLQRLLAADLLVLSFPLWWFSMPAVLKGWVDRVFVMGATFGGPHGLFAEGGLKGKRAVLLITTGGSEEAFRPGEADGYGDLSTFLFHIHRGMLEFVGYRTLAPVVTHRPARIGDDERAAALDRVRDRFHELALLPVGGLSGRS